MVNITTNFFNNFDPVTPYKNVSSKTEDFNSLMISPLSPDSRIETYEDLVVNLSAAEKQKLEDAMSLLPNYNHELENVVLALQKEEVNVFEPVWQETTFPLYALLALKKRQINGMTFTTSQLFYNAMNHPTNKGKVRVVSLFDGEAPNSLAWNIIQETSEVFYSQFEKDGQPQVKNFHPVMTSQQQANFFDLVRKLPSIEQRLLLVPDTKPLSLEKQKILKALGTQTITQAIQMTNGRFNFCCRLSDRLLGKPMRIIPSKGIMQAYSFATGGITTLITQFKLASNQDLKQKILLNERPLCLNFAYLKKETTADNFQCQDQFNEIEFHDFYHLYVIKFVKEDCPQFYGMSEVMEKIAIKNPDIKEIAMYWNRFLIDMEPLAYSLTYTYIFKNGEKFSKKSLFWASMGRIVNYTIKKENLKNQLATFDLFMIHELLQQADFYRDRYGLTVDFLLELNVPELHMATASTRSNFEYLIELAKKIKAELDRYVDPASLETLLEHSKNIESYLIREEALKCLRKKLTLKTIHRYLTLAKEDQAFTAYRMGLEFLAAHYKELVVDQTISLIVKQDLATHLRHSIHFESLIKEAVSENDVQAFNLLMQDQEFAILAANRVFSDGLTLMQTACQRDAKDIIQCLIRLEASFHTI